VPTATQDKQSSGNSPLQCSVVHKGHVTAWGKLQLTQPSLLCPFGDCVHQLGGGGAQIRPALRLRRGALPIQVSFAGRASQRRLILLDLQRLGRLNSP